jgi:peroxiredoxin
MASAWNHNKRFTGLVGRAIEEIVQLSGLLARATVIIGLKMQGDVEYEMIGDRLGKDTRQRVRTHDASAFMLLGHR